MTEEDEDIICDVTMGTPLLVDKDISETDALLRIIDWHRYIGDEKLGVIRQVWGYEGCSYNMSCSVNDVFDGELMDLPSGESNRVEKNINEEETVDELNVSTVEKSSTNTCVNPQKHKLLGRFINFFGHVEKRLGFKRKRRFATEECGKGITGVIPVYFPHESIAFQKQSTKGTPLIEEEEAPLVTVEDAVISYPQEETPHNSNDDKSVDSINGKHNKMLVDGLECTDGDMRKLTLDELGASERDGNEALNCTTERRSVHSAMSTSQILKSTVMMQESVLQGEKLLYSNGMSSTPDQSNLFSSYRLEDLAETGSSEEGDDSRDSARKWKMRYRQLLESEEQKDEMLQMTQKHLDMQVVWNNDIAHKHAMLRQQKCKEEKETAALIERYEKKIKELEASNNKFETEDESSVVEIWKQFNELKNEYFTINKFYKNYEEENKKAFDKVKNLEYELKAVSEIKEEVEQRVNVLTKELQMERIEKESKIHEMNVLTQTGNMQSVQLQKLQQEVMASQHGKEAAEENAENARKQLEILIAENEALKQQISAMEKRHSASNETLIPSKKEDENFKSTSTQTNEEIVEMKEVDAPSIEKTVEESNNEDDKMIESEECVGLKSIDGVDIMAINLYDELIELLQNVEEVKMVPKDMQEECIELIQKYLNDAFTVEKRSPSMDAVDALQQKVLTLRSKETILEKRVMALEKQLRLQRETYLKLLKKEEKMYTKRMNEQRKLYQIQQHGGAIPNNNNTSFPSSPAVSSSTPSTVDTVHNGSVKPLFKLKQLVHVLLRMLDTKIEGDALPFMCKEIIDEWRNKKCGLMVNATKEEFDDFQSIVDAAFSNTRKQKNMKENTSEKSHVIKEEGMRRKYIVNGDNKCEDGVAEVLPELDAFFFTIFRIFLSTNISYVLGFINSEITSIHGAVRRFQYTAAQTTVVRLLKYVERLSINRGGHLSINIDEEDNQMLFSSEGSRLLFQCLETLLMDVKKSVDCLTVDSIEGLQIEAYNTSSIPKLENRVMVFSSINQIYYTIEYIYYFIFSPFINKRRVQCEDPSIKITPFFHFLHKPTFHGVQHAVPLVSKKLMMQIHDISNALLTDLFSSFVLPQLILFEVDWLQLNPSWKHSCLPVVHNQPSKLQEAFINYITDEFEYGSAVESTQQIAHRLRRMDIVQLAVFLDTLQRHLTSNSCMNQTPYISNKLIATAIHQYALVDPTSNVEVSRNMSIWERVLEWLNPTSVVYPRNNNMFPLLQMDNAALATHFTFWQACGIWYMHQLNNNMLDTNNDKGVSLLKREGSQMSPDNHMRCIVEWLFPCEDEGDEAIGLNEFVKAFHRIKLKRSMNEMYAAWALLAGMDDVKKAEKMKLSKKLILERVQVLDASMLFYEYCKTKSLCESMEETVEILKDKNNELCQKIKLLHVDRDRLLKLNSATLQPTVQPLLPMSTLSMKTKSNGVPTSCSSLQYLNDRRNELEKEIQLMKHQMNAGNMQAEKKTAKGGDVTNLLNVLSQAMHNVEGMMHELHHRGK